MMYSDKPPPLLHRIWHAALLIFGIVLLLAIVLQMLSAIWGWLLLLTLIAGLIAVLVAWLRSRRNRW